MEWHKDSIEVSTHGKGLYPFTDAVAERLHRWDVHTGIVYLYLQHTSASLVISENYDPTARKDMQTFMEKLVPAGQPWMQHTLEGPDDSTSHLRAMLTLTSVTIPVDDGQLNLGTWQGIYLFEHRTSSHHRKILVRCLAID